MPLQQQEEDLVSIERRAQGQSPQSSTRMASDGGAACRRASAAAEESCRLIKKRARMSKAVTWEQVAEHTTEEQKVRCCLSHARLGAVRTGELCACSSRAGSQLSWGLGSPFLTIA